MNLTWIGHATVLIDLGGVRLLTDPLLRPRLGHLRRHGPPPAPEVLRDVGAVLVSHLHFDHLDLASLRRLPSATPLVVPRGAARLLRRHGFPHAHELAAGEVAEVAGAEVLAVDAVHDGHRRPLGGAAADTLGYVLDRRVYFAGDTDLFAEMTDLAGIEVALLPVWGWGPTLGDGHLDPQAAARAAAMLRPRIAMPIRWGTFYPRGMHRLRADRLTDPPHEFAAAVARLAPDVKVRVVAPGGSVAV